MFYNNITILFVCFTTYVKGALTNLTLDIPFGPLLAITKETINVFLTNLIGLDNVFVHNTKSSNLPLSYDVIHFLISHLL